MTSRFEVTLSRYCTTPSQVCYGTILPTYGDVYLRFNLGNLRFDSIGSSNSNLSKNSPSMDSTHSWTVPWYAVAAIKRKGTRLIQFRFHAPFIVPLSMTDWPFADPELENKIVFGCMSDTADGLLRAMWEVGAVRKVKYGTFGCKYMFVPCAVVAHRALRLECVI